MTETPETPEQTPAASTGAADVPPDRLAINPRSPHFDADLLGRGIGIRFKGVEKNNVEEYCISEGWIRVQAGKTMDRKPARRHVPRAGRRGGGRFGGFRGLGHHGVRSGKIVPRL